MSVRAAVWCVVFSAVLACRTGREAVPASSVRVDEGPGYFPLPEALSQDPTKLAVPPLEFAVKKPERVVLENGLTVYLLPDRVVPLVTVRALVWGGTIDEPAEKLGVANVTLELLTSGGAGSRKPEELEELFEFHAADVGGAAGDETSWVEMNVRSQDLPKLLPAFADLLVRPKFDPARFEVTVSRYEEAVRRRPDSPDGLAARAAKKAVFGPDSVFARESTAKTLKALAVADVRAFHAKVFVPKATALLVSGDFEREAMLGLIRGALGSWKGGDRVARNYPAQAAATRRVFFVPKKIAQAKIRVAGFGFKRLAPEEYGIRVMNTAVGGGIGVGRLFREVRDSMGLAYSAYSMVSAGPTTGFFLAGVDTKPETAGKALEATLAILKDATGPRPIDRRELTLAADMYMNSFAFRFDSAEKIVREKALLDLFGYPETYLDDFRANISKVDEAATVSAARLIVKPDAFQVVVVGPEAIEPALSAFGPVTVIRDVEAFR